jgi:pimeloyl-ACP methyl ester carboxylesterase
MLRGTVIAMRRDSGLFLPEPGHNNLWYHFNDSDVAVVFVHGIFSDSRDCWLHRNKAHPARSVYWPALVRSDARFGNPSIYLAGFYTALDAGPCEIRNCADEIFRGLGRKDTKGRAGPLDKGTLVFVCHSIGGVVVRYLLETHEASFAGKEIGLVMIASPSYGSTWANRLDWLSKFYNQQLGIQLQWGSWSLRDLDARFRDLVDQRRLRLHGVEAYENHFIFHRSWLPDKRFLVTEASAGRYFGAPILLRKTNHFTAVKPDGPDHPAHELLVDFWGKVVLGYAAQRNEHARSVWRLRRRTKGKPAGGNRSGGYVRGLRAVHRWARRTICYRLRAL